MTEKFKHLKKVVIENSESDSWYTAKDEWAVEPEIIEDATNSENCICGQENLRYLFKIKNTINGNILFPIGSQCIKQFNNESLTESVTTLRKLLSLVNAANNGEYIRLKSKLFSRKLLKYLYDNKVFKETQYNHGDPKKDYLFLLKMFNKRSIPEKWERKKIDALILNYITPYAKEKAIKGRKNEDTSNFIEDLYEELGGESRIYFDTETEQDFGNYIEWPSLEEYSHDELIWVASSLELNISKCKNDEEIIELIRTDGSVPEGTYYERDGEEGYFPAEAKDPRMHPDE